MVSPNVKAMQVCLWWGLDLGKHERAPDRALIAGDCQSMSNLLCSVEFSKKSGRLLVDEETGQRAIRERSAA